MIGFKELPGVNSVAKYVTGSNAAEFGLESEMNQLKEWGENPEKIVETLASSMEAAIMKPDMILERVKSVKTTIVKK